MPDEDCVVRVPLVLRPALGPSIQRPPMGCCLDGRFRQTKHTTSRAERRLGEMMAEQPRAQMLRVGR
jgi:hypothetical protein